MPTAAAAAAASTSHIPSQSSTRGAILAESCMRLPSSPALPLLADSRAGEGRIISSGRRDAKKGPICHPVLLSPVLNGVMKGGGRASRSESNYFSPPPTP